MAYRQVRFSLSGEGEEIREVLIALLSEMAYEAFQEEEDSFTAYIEEEIFDSGSLADLLADPVFSSSGIKWEDTELPDINWNEEWEKNYQPVIIDSICAILAPHHPKQETEYTILIDPRMSFGTGHHETTRLMIRQIYGTETTGRIVLDMGCGTGVLGIFCLMRGATHITAIDIDEWAWKNSIENFRVNSCQENSAEILIGDASAIPSREYDIVLANINRNILLEDMDKYLVNLRSGGELILSGLLQSDREIIMQKAHDEGLNFLLEICENNWISLKFRK